MKYPLFMDTREVNLMNKKIILLPLAALTLGAVSCGSKVPPRASDTIYVCVYDGDYGTKWIDEAAKEYEAKTGVKVEWQADQAILTRIEGELAAPSYDIYMSHDISWQKFAGQGLLENLDDLYEMDVEGTGKKFKERLSDEAKKVSVFNDHYYKVCYTQGAGGLLYNMDMFKENGWSVPTTYEELVTLCATIKAANIDYGDEGGKVVPFAWAGSGEAYLWDYVVFEWWAQLGGTNAIDFYKAFKGDDGKYATGYQVYNPATHYKEFNQAYKMWYDLVGEHPEYSNTNAQVTNINTARSLFATGGAAMMPYAHWAKYAIEKTQQLDFDIAFMKTPRATGATTDYNYNVGYGDSMLIPARAPAESKLAAKQFLAYLATKEGCKSFTKNSKGALFAFDYSIVDLGDLMEDKYIASVYNKTVQCTNFNVVSTNPVAIINNAAIMPWINNEYYYAKAYAKPAGEIYQPSDVANAIYTAAQAGWANWVKRAGVHD